MVEVSSSYGSVRAPYRWRRIVGLVLMLAACLSTVPVAAQRAASNGSSVHIPPEATVGSLFRDFLHYARLGRFSVADAYAQALLAHPDLSPVAVLEAAGRDPKSLDTLLVLIKNDVLGESAARVLALIHQGEFERRKDPERIRRNIELLGGNPQQEFYAIRHLAESGEYAVPQLIATLLDPAQASLRNRIIRALPLIGKSAVNPLVMALRTTDDDVRQHVIRSLGEIGYVQAVPYLRRLLEDPETSEESRAAVEEALMRIAELSGRPVSGSAAEWFVDLAERYYDEDDAVRADERLDEANVWYWDAGAEALRRVVVPTKIFGPVMAMRSTEEALLLEPDLTDALALWLAANTRREARLGYDIESADPNEQAEADPTRPDVFPRALYFTQTAGPRYAHLMLARAVRDNDSHVALAAIAALRVTAGESSLVGADDYKQPLVQALQFPDLAVRVKAALALGAALPRTGFAGSAHVVPVLAATLGLTGREQVLVIDPEESGLNRTMAAFRTDNRDVIGASSVYQGLERVRREMPALRGIVMATDVRDPGVAQALRELRTEFLFAKTPVVILVKPTQEALAEDLARTDRYAERVPAGAPEADLIAAMDRAAERANRVKIDQDEALSLALAAAATLRDIALNGRTVYDISRAEPALIAALSSPHEELQVRAAQVLALLPSDSAQRAIAFIALDPGQTDSLRLAAFASLAESARANGNRLEPDQVETLIRIAAEEPDLTMRTAASQALGALNLTANQASEIVRSYYKG